MDYFERKKIGSGNFKLKLKKNKRREIIPRFYFICFLGPSEMKEGLLTILSSNCFNYEVIVSSNELGKSCVI